MHCTHADLYAIAVVFVLLLALTAFAITVTCFIRHLRTTHPSTWEELENQRQLIQDNESGVDPFSKYLFGGRYFGLGDPDLTKLGNTATILLIAVLLLAAAIFLVPIPLSAARCLWGN
jgi:hypothetical protein